MDNFDNTLIPFQMKVHEKVLETESRPESRGLMQ